ncbi:hypothetical protein H8S37_04180 [Mediterraneibacter sp. NSJ-55]|uniref:Uncharacterized protein n=1 Tax=Mediterraneibacter hominis TaxID=2763054 RepID=A0A923LHG0_9FIRM|nr:hypothetical protein [Mediterraneibacter hominis]MBC5688131.1 hypothetical protein [Mediterraneibacter hominis]
MKVWITKYALTDGIIEAESDTQTQDKEKIFAFWNNDEFGIFYPKKEEVFFDKQSAIKKAEEMCRNKIASLKKQIEKLEGMKFE